MKISLNRPISDEKGQAMLLALILLLISGLIAAPLLSFVGTGVLTGAVYATRTAELYAADAGVENAMWKIQHQVDIPTGCSQDTTRSYNITDVNGKQVAYNITRANNETLTYQIVSIATGNSSATQVEAYITGKSRYGDYSGMLEHIAISQNVTDIAKKVTLIYPAGCGPEEHYAGSWPPPSELCDWYWTDVKNVTPYGSDTIDIAGVDTTKGPLYRAGTLIIKNSSSTPATLKLTGTLYISGDTSIAYGTSNNREMTLDLNGNTIFVASNSTGSGKEALKIGDQCNIKGPGCIIAIGDIYFKPKSQVTTDPVFVLSIIGTTTMQPSGNFYGALAGSVEVEVRQGEKPTLTYPEGGFGTCGLNFPIGATQRLVFSIASWEVSQP
jgi:hypothetical protein